MQRRLVLGTLTAMVCVAGASGVRAQGFGLNEIGTCAVARGHSGTGAPCRDASVIYWNPAAATLLPGFSMYVGVAAIDLGGSFTHDSTGRVDDNTVATRWPLHLFMNYARGRWAFGAGAYVPYGLTTQWNADFPGRFVAQRASLTSVYFQGNVAYAFAPGWSVGGGPVVGYSQVSLRQSIDLSQQIVPGSAALGTPITFGLLGIPFGTEFARGAIEGSDVAYGFNVGIHGQITPTIEVGARYLSKLEFSYDDAKATFEQVATARVIPAPLPLPTGDTIPAGTPLDAVLAAQFAPGGPLSNQGASTSIHHPAQAEVGIGYSGLPRTKLSFDVAWVDWSAFKELDINFAGAAPDQRLIQDYEDSWSFRSGIEYAFPRQIMGRAGFNFVQTPVPDVTVSPILPDMDRYNLTLGVGVPVTDHLSLDATYLRVESQGRRGRIVERTSRAQTAAELNSGFYTLDANVWSFSLNAHF
ncbi:MAG TPA: outer membrane protein transport protein [Gemmatimonadaceae bacterium]|nr:outer membrane protein transport protein [Gemmatimonadaceae bacterium]